MNANKSRTAIHSALAVAAAITFIAAAQPQTSQTAGAPPSHYNLLDLGIVTANGMNDVGQVTGTFSSGGVAHAFRTQPNAPVNTATDDLMMDPNIRSSGAVAINNSGQVLGVLSANSVQKIFLTAPNSSINLATDVVGTNSPDRPNSPVGLNNSGAFLENGYLPSTFLYNPNTHQLNALTFDGYASSANGLNDSGQVVGGLLQPNPGPFRTEPYSAVNRSTDYLGNGFSGANALNNSAQVVGTISTSGAAPFFAYRTAPNGWINPATDYLVSPGGSQTIPAAINASGLVVGAADTAGGSRHAFVFSRGVIYDLNNLVDAGTSAVLTGAATINALGQILVRGVQGTDTHAYLLTPSSMVAQCQVAGTTSPRQLIFTIQDAVSGVQSIAVTGSANATTGASSYSPGTKAPVTVTASAVDAAQIASVRLNIQTTRGEARSCGSAILPEPAQWTGRGGVFISNITVVSDGSGRLEAFGLGTDNALWHAAQPAPAEPWETWASLGGYLTGSPAAAVDRDGRFEVFATSEGGLWNIAQTARGSWSGSTFQNIATGVKDQPVVVRNGAGMLQAFVRTLDDELAYVTQSNAGSASWQPLHSLGGTIESNPAAIVDADDSVQVFAAGSDQALWHTGLKPDGSVTPWSSLGGIIKGDPSVVARAGAVYVFVRGSDDALWFKSEIDASAWSDWRGLGGQMIGNPQSAINADGRAEAFVVGTDNALWHIAQTNPGSVLWNDWSTLGGFLFPNSLAVRSSDSTVNVYGLGGDSGLWQISQPLPGRWD